MKLLANILHSQCTVTAATDTYADELHATVDNSASTTLAEQPDTNKRQWIYLRFDLTARNVPTHALSRHGKDERKASAA